MSLVNLHELEAALTDTSKRTHHLRCFYVDLQKRLEQPRAAPRACLDRLKVRSQGVRVPNCSNENPEYNSPPDVLLTRWSVCVSPRTAEPRILINSPLRRSCLGLLRGLGEGRVVVTVLSGEGPAWILFCP